MSENYWTLVSLGEKSQLKTDLNRGVAALAKASENCFRPHICLNKLDGIEVICKITQNPEQANTEFMIGQEIIYGGGSDLWLNVRFLIFLNTLSSNDLVQLSPRQTASVVVGLPQESKKTVLEKIKDWYFKYFSGKMREALEKITRQFNEGYLLAADDHENRIFDIHGGRYMDVPYTEWRIVGEELFERFFFGHTFFQHGQDGYNEIDSMFAVMEKQRKSAVNGMLGLMRLLHDGGPR